MDDKETLYKIAVWLVKNLCIDTNATTAKYTLEGFGNNITGEKYGDYEITIKKKILSRNKKDQ